MVDRLSFLSEEIPRDTGVPLRARVHSRILDAIRSGVLPPGSMIPTETELGQLMGVSRTVVREALMLLDEDGFLFSRRGVGRFVADTLPPRGLERIRPLEELLSTPASPVVLSRSEVTLQHQSATFVTEGLGLRANAATWFFETVLSRDGEAVALSQEHFPAAGAIDAGTSDAIAAAMRAADSGTLLSILLNKYGPRIGPGAVRIMPGVPGASRAALLGTPAGEPVLIMTQTAALSGAPCYLAKHLVLSRAGHLSILQTG
ncbi:GntR family transcriptional regulator IolR [Planotetraspora phitsanulokensis]|uniref:Transcriptional regulator n=1 Tax=Planotetraspora phitsanulokensis TaxID=575192 RepID=A0A8J3U370_9ACTN|nr:GntR family transcriptional regulator [Planotetraspora phitsanulokensis]GII36117.1 transcriptional regulator [Planotetraspora phitsanulokensis]